MELTELQKFELINAAETTSELKEAIIKIADTNGYIKGRNKSWEANQQSNQVDFIICGIMPFNALTRSYGIRQQMLYLMHYSKVSENDKLKALEIEQKIKNDFLNSSIDNLEN